MAQIQVLYKDTFTVKLVLQRSDAYDLRKNLNAWFAQFTANYQFDWRFKNRRWDGKIRFYNSRESTIPRGLISELKKFAKTFDYSIDIDDGIYIDNFTDASKDEIQDFIFTFVKSLNLPFEPRSYQYKYFAKFVQKNIELLISPTSSGKSLIIYMALRYALSILPKDQKALIIVPTIQLVDQMYGDFEEYGFNSEKHCARIYSGSRDQNVKLKTDKKVILSTWQSLYKLPKSEFKDIGFITADEIHRFGAKESKTVITNCDNAIFRMGTTGTLQDSDKCSLWTIQGMFDEPVKYVSTKNLIDKGHISDVGIEVLNLIYPDDMCKICKDFAYNDEIDYISLQEDRVNLIVKLVKRLLKKDENVLLLFSKIEYGRRIKEAIEEQIYDNKQEVAYVDGTITMKYREGIRKEMENASGIPLVASYGTFSTGINIRNLHHVVLLNSTKAEIKLLQSIGRTLRLHKSKTKAKIWDIVDNLSYKKRMNYALRHFVERKKIYAKEVFNISFHDIKMYK